jgi:transposase
MDTHEDGYNGCQEARFIMGRRSFTAEFKEQAARQVIQGGRSFKQVADDLGIDPSSLRHWVRLARAAGVTPPQALVDADPAKRVRELEAEVARLKMERESLKKAAAFFAKESTGEGGRP